MSAAQKVQPVPLTPGSIAPANCGWQLPVLRFRAQNSEGKYFVFPKQAVVQNGMLKGLPFWWGILMHTTGSGILSLAKKRGWTPEEAAVWTYSQEWMNCAHYLNPPSGKLIQVVSESLIAPHCGVKPWQYAAMKDGTWDEKCPDKMVEKWREAWPRVKSPVYLYPHAGSANPDVLGVENIPQEDGTFTDAQYTTLKTFVADRNKFYGMGIEHRRNRLLGHEDVNPFFTKDNGRADKKGGWDPGARRDVPKFFWDRMRP